MQNTITDLYKLKPAAILAAFTAENFAFWMSCAYLFFEYVRPQAIWPAFEVYPYWARTFVILALLGWLLDPQKRLVWTKITTGVFVFLLLVILSSMFAYWPEISNENFMLFFNWAVIFFVLTQVITTRKRFYVFLLIFLIASFKLSLYGARTFAARGFAFADWGLRGPQGFFENPGELAIQMVVFGPIALFFVLSIRPYLKKWQIWLLYLMPVTAVLTVIGTNTRGGQIAIAAVLLTMIAMTKHRIKAFLIITIIGIAAYNVMPHEQMQRFETIGEDNTSQQRLLYWNHGWQMIKDHPFLGVGYFNFVPYYERHHIDDIVIPHHARDGYVELPHNVIIQVGTDVGMLGLTVYMLIITGAFLVMRRIIKEAEYADDLFIAYIGKGMNLALLGFFVAGQFVSVAYYPYLWIHLVFVVSMATFWNNEKTITFFPDSNATSNPPIS